MSRVSATLAPLLIHFTPQAHLSGPGPRDFIAALLTCWNKDNGLGARGFLLDRHAGYIFVLHDLSHLTETSASSSAHGSC
ncbi:hypothetical protein BDV09DRAFT_181877 [Aspergillus tetrazonus]